MGGWRGALAKAGHRIWRAANAILVIGGLVGYGLQAANVFVGLDAGTRFWFTVAASLALLVGGSWYLYKVTAFLEARRETPTAGGTETQIRQLRLLPLVCELQELGGMLEALVQGSTEDSLPYLFSRASPGQSIMNLYGRSLRDPSRDMFSRVRALRPGQVEEKEFAGAAKGVTKVAIQYLQFLDEYQRNVNLGPGEHMEMLHRCIEAYNHVARHLTTLAYELERAVGGELFQAEQIPTRIVEIRGPT